MGTEAAEDVEMGREGGADAGPERGGGEDAGEGREEEEAECAVCRAERPRIKECVGCVACGAWAHAICAGRKTAAQRAKDWRCNGCLAT